MHMMIPILLKHLVRIAKELAGDYYVLVAVGKVPAYNGGVLTATDDSTGVKLQLEDS